MQLWRISKFPTLDGRGGLLAPGRWHNAGKPIVYLAASPPGALIEILVHLELKAATVPSTYTLLEITVPDNLDAPLLYKSSVDVWKVDESITRKTGDEWLASQGSALVRVPSAIIPKAFNYLLNPNHPDAARLQIASLTKAEFDQRLVASP